MDQEKQNWNMYYIKGAWKKATKKEKKHKEVGKNIGRSAAAALTQPPSLFRSLSVVVELMGNIYATVDRGTTDGKTEKKGVK